MNKRTGNLSSDRKKELLKFLERNPALQTGKFSNHFTFEKAQGMWMEVSNTLNSLPGAHKDWRQWRKPVIDSINGQTEEEEVQDKLYLRVRDKVVENPKKYPSWRYGQGKLYKHVMPAFSELGETTDAWKLVVPKEQRKRVLTEVHERATSGHQGVYKTFHRIAEKYYLA
ncbi:hypothetical protein JTB14_036795 [Gonioctena quinquepunctata]|nr:hypothetical protein JTB14_036795 [Gonioctena quinquepunctata]